MVRALVAVVVLPAVGAALVLVTGSVSGSGPGTLLGMYTVLAVGGAIAGRLWIWQTWYGKVAPGSVGVHGPVVSGRTGGLFPGYREVRLDRLRSFSWVQVSYDRFSADRLLLRDADGGSLVLPSSSSSPLEERILGPIRQAVLEDPQVRMSRTSRVRLAEGRDPQWRRLLPFGFAAAMVIAFLYLLV